MNSVLTLDKLSAQLGSGPQYSPWITIDQDRITRFAEVTEDRQFIHVDPEAAAHTPFGATVAHGFLTLSLLSHMAEQTMSFEGASMGVNYGFDRVRFMAPVKVGSRVRGRFEVAKIRRRSAGQFQVNYEVAVEIDGQPKPALAATWITLVLA